MNRIESIDIAKGIGIVCVVLGHSLSEGSFLRLLIYTFHMPLFFFLSGLCMNVQKYGKTEFTVKLVKQLIRPLVSYTVLITLLQFFLSEKADLSSLSYNLPGALWFLLVLFVAEILWYFTRQCKNKLVMVSILSLSIIAGLALNNYGVILPYALSTTFIAVFFVGCGNMVGREKFLSLQDKAANYPPPYKLIFLVFGIVVHATYVILFRDSMDLFYNKFSFSDIFFSFIGIALVLMASISKPSKSHTVTIFQYLGKNSLIIMSTHMFFLSLIKTHLSTHISSYMIRNISEQLILWTATILVIEIINRNRLICLGAKNDK